MSIMLKNKAGHEFHKRPDVCPNCSETLKTNIEITGSELNRFNVTVENPYLYSVTEVVKSSFNKLTGNVDHELTGWFCNHCNSRFEVS